MSAPLVQDQVEAGVQPVPALLQRRDARVAALISRATTPAGREKARLVEGGDRRLPGRARRSLIMAGLIAAGDASRGLRSSTTVFHWSNSWAACCSVGAQFGEQLLHAAVDSALRRFWYYFGF